VWLHTVSSRKENDRWFEGGAKNGLRGEKVSRVAWGDNSTYFGQRRGKIARKNRSGQGETFAGCALKEVFPSRRQARVKNRCAARKGGEMIEKKDRLRQRCTEETSLGWILR